MIKALLITWCAISLGLLLSLYWAATRSAKNCQTNESNEPTDRHPSRRSLRGSLEQPPLNNNDES